MFVSFLFWISKGLTTQFQREALDFQPLVLQQNTDNWWWVFRSFLLIFTLPSVLLFLYISFPALLILNYLTGNIWISNEYTGRILIYLQLRFSSFFFQLSEAYSFYVQKMLAERHGQMKDLKICLNSFAESNEIHDDMLTLADCGVKGEPKVS